jgi:hypothetical protein
MTLPEYTLEECRNACNLDSKCIAIEWEANDDCELHSVIDQSRTEAKGDCIAGDCCFTKEGAQVFDFELRGRIGDEVVIITRGEDKHTETLSTDYKAFSATNENIVITFKNDVGPPEQDVYFNSSVHTNIRSDGLFFTMELWDIK